MKNIKRIGFALLSILTIGLLAACGSGNDTTDNANGEASSEQLEGSVVVDGSGTVYPLMARIAEEYMLTEQESVSVEVGRSGTSAGFEKFLTENGTDFNNASRQIKDKESATAEELGIEVKELKVALDGLTIVTHPDNNWATEMTTEEIINIFKADGNVTKWSDINPDWPDEKINTYGPNENHGTYEFFYETIMEEQDLVSNIDLQQEYSTLVTLISQDPNAIGFFGFGYYANNQDSLQAVSVDFGDGAVEPSLETIDESGPYAGFTRPVFTYLNVNNAKEKAQVIDYARFVMENVNTFAGETGFAPIPDEEVEANLDFLNGLE
ncbi:PstS family phosphate ABC transporter substrate-binding protein [Paraliobacillus salinarum]|uniref:PstS family phosphate ABC transporter substrate-binding protein n=1 Tax=Paraliobacillus salinarum TaxID=1158996 RepID=UPI0015F4709C|nr:PstS family phosphate ABC transporter substrate-binding protein [Paraliobacillus salinarum]